MINMLQTTTLEKNIIDETGFAKLPKIGEIVEGKVIGKGRAAVYFDLGNWRTGVIYGREFFEAKNELKHLKPGDSIFAKIVDMENEDGYIELSLTRAGKELAWETLKQKKDKNETITVKILGANKGGLLADVMGIPAFLPVSQLSPENYPKVEGGDNQKILKALQKFISQELEVKIFDLEPSEEKLILSEKAKDTEKIRELLKGYKVGDVVEGEITGVVDFGAFVKFSLPAEEGSRLNSLEGLIHISELDWQLISNPAEIVKVGEKVKAKIIDIANDKISLSLKALKKDPWEGIEEKYKKGDNVKGKVVKFNSFGAFVQLSDDPKIQGLCHISEFNADQRMEDSMALNQEYKFQILSIEPKDHRMSLKMTE